jgi:hypothetical protein
MNWESQRFGDFRSRGLATAERVPDDRATDARKSPAAEQSIIITAPWAIPVIVLAVSWPLILPGLLKPPWHGASRVTEAIARIDVSAVATAYGISAAAVPSAVLDLLD